MQGSAERFPSHGAEHKAWREKVDATPLGLLTAEAIEQGKLRHIGRHKDSPEEHGRAVNTVNAQIRNARSLFTSKGAVVCGQTFGIA